MFVADILLMFEKRRKAIKATSSILMFVSLSAFQLSSAKADDVSSRQAFAPIAETSSALDALTDPVTVVRIRSQGALSKDVFQSSQRQVIFNDTKIMRERYVVTSNEKQQKYSEPMAEFGWPDSVVDEFHETLIVTRWSDAQRLLSLSKEKKVYEVANLGPKVPVDVDFKHPTKKWLTLPNGNRTFNEFGRRAMVPVDVFLETERKDVTKVAASYITKHDRFLEKYNATTPVDGFKAPKKTLLERAANRVKRITGTLRPGKNKSVRNNRRGKVRR